MTADTEARLRDWRYGQTQAERLAAALLHLEGFKEVDPQHPLGGPDGLKDVLCRKDRMRWVAAAYFPSTQPTFADIERKFESDLQGVQRNRAEGFAFFVNQQLTIAQRRKLIATAEAVHTEVFHLERMCGLLNAPKGYGIRLEYLRILMNEAEQFAFWSTLNADMFEKLARNEQRRDVQLKKLDQKLDRLLARTSAIASDLHALPSSLSQGTLPPEHTDLPTASVSPTMLCWLHRVLTDDLEYPEAVRGRFRAVQVWIGSPGAGRENAVYTPPAPDQIQTLISEFTDWWRKRHVSLRGMPKAEVALGLAELHHRFLHIHPFLDANGRVARCLLDQASRELLNQSIGPGFTAPPQDYYATLLAGDRGDLVPLQQRILASLQ